VTSEREEDNCLLQKKFSTQALLLTLQQPAYVRASCPKVGCVCMCAGPLQVVYTYENSQKIENQQSSTGKEYWYGRPKSIKDTESYRNSKIVSKLIQKHTKKYTQRP
jgi:hypothetical protein